MEGARGSGCKAAVIQVRREESNMSTHTCFLWHQDEQEVGGEIVGNSKWKKEMNAEQHWESFKE